MSVTASKVTFGSIVGPGNGVTSSKVTFGIIVGDGAGVVCSKITYGIIIDTLTPEPSSHVLTAGTGTFTLTGVAATLTKGRTMAADAGAFTLTGQPAGLIISRRLIAETGVFTLTGQDVSFGHSYPLTAEPGAFVLTGNDAILTVARHAHPPPERVVVLPEDPRIIVVEEQSRTVAIKPQNRSIIVIKDIEMYTLPERSIDDLLDYGVDWSQWLQEGETISTKEVVASRGNTAVSSVANDTADVTFWLGGGSTYPPEHHIDVKITTSAGRTRKVTLQIPVVA